MREQTKQLLNSDILGKMGLTFIKEVPWVRNNSSRIVAKDKYGEVKLVVRNLLNSRIKQISVDSAVDKTAYTISKFRSIHGDYYDYTDVIYKCSTCKVQIKCPKHGKFLQAPSDHLSGYGCISCGFEAGATQNALTTEEFIQKATRLHGSTYDYSLVEYVNSKSKVKIICKIHGVFTQSPADHLAGCRCQQCAEDSKGWTYTRWENAGQKSMYFDAYKVYLIKCTTPTEVFFKIGKTFTTLHERFKGGGNKVLPYPFKVMHTYAGDARSISELETALQMYFKDRRYTPKLPFKGSTECFTTIAVKEFKQAISKLRVYL